MWELVLEAYFSSLGMLKLDISHGTLESNLVACACKYLFLTMQGRG
jgi:hypothetical protein